MNKNKKLFSLLVGLFCVLGLASCKHTHTFAEEWSKDATNHWHAATCDHTEEKADVAAHTWNQGEVTTPATHEADGVKTFTCTVCGQTKTEAVPKGQHAWDEGVITTPATCTQAGVMTFTCACGATKTEPIGQLQHIELADVVFNFHYELKDGETYCPELKTEEAIKDLIVTTADKSSFTVTNLSKVYGEATSGSNYSTFDVMKFGSSGANGTAKFEFAFNVEKVIVKAAGWGTSDALTINGTKKTLTNKLTGEMNFVEYEYTFEATKVVDILTEKRVVISEITFVPVGTKTNVVAPTCTTAGSYDQLHICAVCGGTIAEPTHVEVAATGHSFATTWEKNETHHWHPATCEHTLEQADYAEHTWNEGRVTTEPTFDTKGVKTYTCTVCGQTKEEEVNTLEGVVIFADGITGGKVTVSTGTPRKGQEVTITATANKGYTLEKVLVNGQELAAVEGAYKFEMTTATATVGATFTKNTADKPKDLYNFAGKTAADLLDDGWTVMKYTDQGWTSTSATLQVGTDYAGQACGTMDAWDNTSVFSYNYPFAVNEYGYTHFVFTAKGNGITTLKVKFTHNADDQYKGIYVVYDLGKMIEGWAEYDLAVTDPNWVVKYGSYSLTAEQALNMGVVDGLDGFFLFFDEVSFVISGNTANGAKCYNQINNLHFENKQGGTSKEIILYALPADGHYVSSLAELQMTNQQMTRANLTMGTNTIPVIVNVNFATNVVTLKDEATEGTALVITGKFVDGGNVVVTKVEGAMAAGLPNCEGLLFFDASKAANEVLDFEAFTTDMDWKPNFIEYRKYASAGWTEWTKLSEITDTIMRIRGKDGSRVANFANGYSTTKQIRLGLGGKILNNVSIDLGNYYTSGQVMKFKISIETTDGKTVYLYGDANTFAELEYVNGGPMVHFTKALDTAVSAKYVIITARSDINGNAYLYLDNLKAWFGAPEQVEEPVGPQETPKANINLTFEEGTVGNQFKGAGWQWQKYTDNWTGWANVSEQAVMYYKDRNGSKVINGKCGWSTTYQYRLDVEGVLANSFSIDLGNYYDGAAKDISYKIHVEDANGNKVYLVGDADNFATCPYVSGSGLATVAQTFTDMEVKYIVITAKSLVSNDNFLYMDNLILNYVEA